GAAGLGEVGTPAAALAAQRLGAELDELDGVVGRRHVRCDTDGQIGLAVRGHAGNHDHARAHLLLALVDKAAQVLRIETLDLAHEELHPARGGSHRGGRIRRLAVSRLAAVRRGQPAPSPWPPPAWLPPSASWRRAVARSRSSCLRSSSNALTR